MKTVRFVVVAVILTLILAGCGAGPHAVVNGKVSDYITNTEPRVNGYYMVFVQTDTTSAYCTSNARIIELIDYLRETHTHSTITYSDVSA